jgi:polysaccharide export outer membrane protein
VWREADLSGTFEVDDRGIVVLPLLGERTVTGMSPDDLRDALLEDYAEYLQNPSVQVTLLRRINILGEVRSPGLYPVDATISLADALALAGGITPVGSPDDIRLIRGDQIIRQDLDRATLVGSAEIRSGDQIVVGRRSWASRNSTAILGSIIAASAIIAAAFIR